MHGERASTVRLREPTEPERKNLHFVLHDACGCTATAAEFLWASWLDGGEPCGCVLVRGGALGMAL